MEEGTAAGGDRLADVDVHRVEVRVGLGVVEVRDLAVRGGEQVEGHECHLLSRGRWRWMRCGCGYDSCSRTAKSRWSYSAMVRCVGTSKMIWLMVSPPLLWLLRVRASWSGDARVHDDRQRDRLEEMRVARNEARRVVRDVVGLLVQRMAVPHGRRLLRCVREACGETDGRGRRRRLPEGQGMKLATPPPAARGAGRPARAGRPATAGQRAQTTRWLERRRAGAPVTCGAPAGGGGAAL